MVFADLCTKESASAPVGGTNSSEAAPQDRRSGGWSGMSYGWIGIPL